MAWIALPYYPDKETRKLERKVIGLRNAVKMATIPREVKELVEQLDACAGKGNVNLNLVALYSHKLRAVKALIEKEQA